MKRLLYLIVVVFTLKVSAQSFAVKNVNDDYVVTNLKGSEQFKNDIIEVLRDKTVCIGLETLCLFLPLMV